MLKGEANTLLDCAEMILDEEYKGLEIKLGNLETCKNEDKGNSDDEEIIGVAKDTVSDKEYKELKIELGYLETGENDGKGNSDDEDIIGVAEDTVLDEAFVELKIELGNLEAEEWEERGNSDDEEAIGVAEDNTVSDKYVADIMNEVNPEDLVFKNKELDFNDSEITTFDVDLDVLTDVMKKDVSSEKLKNVWIDERDEETNGWKEGITDDDCVIVDWDFINEDVEDKKANGDDGVNEENDTGVKVLVCKEGWMDINKVFDPDFDRKNDGDDVAENELDICGVVRSETVDKLVKKDDEGIIVCVVENSDNASDVIFVIEETVKLVVEDLEDVKSVMGTDVLTMAVDM